MKRGFFSSKINKLRFIHPFLFAFFPALFLYTYNINLFKENVLIIPLLVSLIFAVIIFLMCLLVIRKLEIAAIISSLLILVFFSYGRLKEPVRNVNFNLGNVFINSDMILFTGILLSLGIITFLIFHNERYLKSINKVLNIFSVVLIVLALYNTIFSEIKLGRVFPPALRALRNETNQLQGFASTQTPDIYYFVLDRYAGDKTLKDYGFDNSAFYNFLQSKGFYIASDSTSNYPKTFLSLPSTLNMEYLDYLTQKTNGGATSDESIATPLIQNNKVIQFLKSKGYFYVHVGSNWSPTGSNPYADRNFIMSGGRYLFADEFTNGFLQTTMASPILNALYPDITAVSQDPKTNQYRSRILYEFGVFDQILKISGPKFVFAHILIPHGPYVLDKDCKPIAEKTTASKTEVENYINQLQCGNKKTEAVIEKILSTSKIKPIIIIQSDEGPMPIVNQASSNLDWKNASNALLNEKFPILNAYLLPDLESNPLYSSITPVNSFRIIFNNYFATNMPLLPDKNIIFEDNHNFYKFIDVTERLKNILNN